MEANVRKIHLYNRDGLLMFDAESKKGVFAYRDVGVRKKDGRPYDKVWFCDVFQGKDDKDAAGQDVFLFNRIHASQRSFNKIGLNVQQLPMMIHLATLLYSDVTGEQVAAPEIKDIKKPDDIDALLNQIHGRRG